MDRTSLSKFFFVLSGDDYRIIERCNKKVQNLFAGIGFFVALIFLSCAISSYFTFTQVFNAYFIGVAASLFVALMMSNIYLLLLYTLSENVLPHKPSFIGKWFSNVIRITFVCFLAVIVSKPIEVLIYSNSLAPEVTAFKRGEIAKYQALTTDYFDREIHEMRIEKLVNPQLSQLLDARIEKLTNEKDRLNKRMLTLVSDSNYYFKTLLILAYNHPTSWLVTLIFGLIFIVPVYLKRIVPGSGIFYGEKRNVEFELIRREYEKFKLMYSELFQRKWKVNVEYSEHYSDAPFNTAPKSDKTRFFDEQQLLTDLYDA